MPRNKNVFKKKKIQRPGPGRGHFRHGEPSGSEVVHPMDNPEEPESIDIPEDEASVSLSAFSDRSRSSRESSVSSSYSKMGENITLYDEFDSPQRYDIIDMEEVNSCMKEVLCCRVCQSTAEMTVVKRIGLASKVSINCTNNGCRMSKSFFSTKEVVKEVKGKYLFYILFFVKKIYLSYFIRFKYSDLYSYYIVLIRGNKK